MFKKLSQLIPGRLNADLKTIVYCIILGIIGYLAFMLVLYDLSN
jgi:hypothetical protein